MRPVDDFQPATAGARPHTRTSSDDRGGILDHFAGHRLRLSGEDEFAVALKPLEGLPNAAVKVSGYLTSNDGVPRANLPYTMGGYIRAAIDILGADRLMYGSDWPICTQAGGYNDTVDALCRASALLTPEELVAISSVTAIDFYRL